MNDKEKAAVDRLKAMDSVVIEQFDPDNAIWCDIRLVLTALQSATERADRAEAVLRVYADGKNWKSPKGSMALILWRPNQDFASTNLGYALARKALEDKQND